MLNVAGLSRFQIEAHLTLHGWKPTRSPGYCLFALFNQAENIDAHETIFSERDGSVKLATESHGGWPDCDWVDMPDDTFTQLVEFLRRRGYL
jgi:hypothetical protein